MSEYLKKVIHEYLEKLDEEDTRFLIQIITIMRYHVKKRPASVSSGLFRGHSFMRLAIVMRKSS
jgi:hypothetical protein